MIVNEYTWVEISIPALKHNMGVFRKLIAQKKTDLPQITPEKKPLLGAVVKSNAYGHDLETIIPALHPLADILLVTAPDDAETIRRIESDHNLSKKRIIVLGAFTPENAVSIAKIGAEAVLTGEFSEKHAESLRVTGLRLDVHVHIDTGLGREGFYPEEIREVLNLFQDNAETIKPVGVCSHFANTEDVTEQEYALRQLDVFRRAADHLCSLTGLDLERHIAASAATMVLPESRFDIIRAGISIYGLWPSVETRISSRLVLHELPELKPVLSWRCRPQLIRNIRAGAYVGYGCTWRASRSGRIAVLPIGYYDGYPRIISGKSHVLTFGARCPVIGRIMMNHIVVDITEVPECNMDTVFTLLGNNCGEKISADTLAAWAQTINYEIVTRIAPHIRRCLSEV